MFETAIMLFSILIATYNRANVVPRAIQSALDFCAAAEVPSEIIVIDDASVDGTAGLIEQQFMDAIAEKKLKFIRLPKNIGVTAARMAGFAAAHGKWMVIFDSDDQFVSEPVAARAFAELLQQNNAPLIFTRCRSVSTEEIIGSFTAAPYDLNLVEFISVGTPGECMPAIRRDVLETIPYDETIRAFEGLTMARQIATFGAALISPLAVRIYNDGDEPDRLSGFAQRWKRAGDLARGFKMFLHEFGRVMPPRVRFAYAARYVFYLFLSLVAR